MLLLSPKWCESDWVQKFFEILYFTKIFSTLLSRAIFWSLIHQTMLKPFAAKTPSGLPERFVILLIIGIYLLSEIHPTLHSDILWKAVCEPLRLSVPFSLRLLSFLEKHLSLSVLTIRFFFAICSACQTRRVFLSTYASSWWNDNFRGHSIWSAWHSRSPQNMYDMLSTIAIVLLASLSTRASRFVQQDFLVFAR